MSNLPQILQHFIQARVRQRVLQGEKLLEFQNRKAQERVRFAFKGSEFYHQHWQDHNLTDWQNLPTINRQMMMAHFDTFNTVGISKKQTLELALRAEQERDFSPTLNGVTVGLSSGTSGQRGIFLVNEAEQAAWTGTILARVLHTVQPERVAFFLRSSSNLYANVGRGRAIVFRYFDLISPLEGIIAQLNSFQPTLLVGPPSVLVRLANAFNQNHLRIRPRRVMAVAEILSVTDHMALEVTFQVPVHQIYQATEGFLAASCLQGRLHLQEDIVAVQWGEYLPHSAQKTPILTDLWRQSQPMIRYALNDLLVLDSRACPCGSSWRVLERIEGRSDDVCFFSTQGGGPAPAVFPDLLGKMVRSSARVRDFVAIQSEVGQLKIHLELRHEDDFPRAVEEVTQMIFTTLHRLGAEKPRLELVLGLPAREGSVKKRRVVGI